MVYQDRTRWALSNGYLLSPIPCKHSFLKGKCSSKNRIFLKIAPGFVYWLYQQLKIIPADRTHRVLSNAYIFTTITCIDFFLYKANLALDSDFLCFSLLDSPLGYTKRWKGYTKIELIELYRMDTFSTRFHYQISEKPTEQHPEPDFLCNSHRDSPTGYTKTWKEYTEIELVEIYRMDTFLTGFYARIPSERANQA